MNELETRPNNSYSIVINPERVAYWFFRINGCTTIPNFIVHPDYHGPSQRTEVDILGVRFPYRAELLTSGRTMQDHEIFQTENKIDIILAEVKHGICRLNGPWTNPPDENMQRVLFAIGAFKEDLVPEVAISIYERGIFENNAYRVRLFAIGRSHNPDILPDAVQLLWDEILSFIYVRFTFYREEKSHHGQWDGSGKKLFNLALRSSKDEFIETIKNYMHNFITSR